MYIMYVDESGTEQKNEQTQYFLVSGVVVHVNHIWELEHIMDKVAFELFPERFKGQEIHVHDIYKGKKEFEGVATCEIQQVLDDLYGSFKDINFSTITIAIDKKRWFKSKYSKYDMLKSAYTFLVKRFDKFLQKNNSKGMVRIDKTSSKLNALNIKDQKILDVINILRRVKSYGSTIQNVVEQPFFLLSATCRGLQVTDAIAYSTNRYLNESQEFDKYWHNVSQKIQRREDDTIEGCGLSLFPK